MKKSMGQLTGIINSKNNIVFYANDFRFSFMASNPNGRGINVVEPDSSGFLHGTTHNKYSISIYIGKNTLRFSGRQDVDVGAYLVSCSNVREADMEGFWGIQFVGGTLNSLFDRSRNAVDFSDDGRLIVDQQDISKTYSVSIDGEICVVQIGSNSSFNSGIDGVHIRDNGVYLKILFPSKKPIKNAFGYYSVLKSMLSFMTFRGNVGVDEIYLLREKDSHGMQWPEAQLFIPKDCNFADKHYFRCLNFDDLSDCVAKLLELLFTNTDKKPTYMFGFFPDDNQDVNVMSNAKIKEICSALECEISFIDDLSTEEDVKLAALIETVKNTVKSHRKSAEKVSSKTYDLIFSSINNWSMSASDRIAILYQRYEAEMLLLNDSSLHITDKEIAEFVKYRNHITHGHHRILDQNVAITAYTLQGLVYCCILKRIGMNDDKIQELCRNKKLLS